jgi:hypothetical protein
MWDPLRALSSAAPQAQSSKPHVMMAHLVMNQRVGLMTALQRAGL